MTQVDLETLVRGTGDGKVACEPLISGGGSGDPPQPPPPPDDPDFPPESIQVPIDDDDLDWSDLNPVYDRDDSTKETTNPKSQQHHSNSNPNPPRSNSQRFSSPNLKANGPIIGLPHKIQHVGGGGRRRPPPTSDRIFPKGKPDRSDGRKLPEYEPSSPKVSCIGKVLSDREREKCRLAHRRSRDGGVGCWKGFLAIFRCGGGERAAAAEDERFTGELNRKPPPPPAAEKEEEEVAAPGLGGMKRFSSGRRAASWEGEEEIVEAAKGRRSVGSAVDARREG